MNLKIFNEGTKFFFVTLTLEGRKKILSKLRENNTRPKLSNYGEVIKSVFVALNKVYSCATISDFVIMPDHIHFILIVRYGLMPEFKPLWVVHRMIDAIEELWNLAGDTPEPQISDDIKLASAIESLQGAVKRGRDDAREMAFKSKTGDCIESYLKETSIPIICCNNDKMGVRGRPPLFCVPRFNRSVYIEFSFNSQQLKTMRRYIKLNPARAIWKEQHPNRFIKYGNIRHAVLDKNRQWDAMGNLTLLASPFLLHVRLTLKKTVAEHESTINEILEKAKKGMVIVSGFISPGEVELLKRLKATSNTRFIKMLPCSMPPRYDPSAEDSRELASDRLLILSGFHNTNHISALEMKRDRTSAHIFRANCLAMNELADKMCKTAQSLV